MCDENGMCEMAGGLMKVATEVSRARLAAINAVGTARYYALAARVAESGYSVGFVE